MSYFVVFIVGAVFLHAGDFIWSQQLATVYPPDPFFWLYGSPVVKKGLR